MGCASQLFQWLSLALGAIWIAGCLPDELPGFTNDGKTIVAVGSLAALWTYDLTTGQATPYPLPKGTFVSRARMLGDQVWVECCPYDESDPSKGTDRTRKYTCIRLDLRKNEYVPGLPELEGKRWLASAIPGSRGGRKCLFVPDKHGTEDGTYSVFSYPDWKKMEAANLDFLMAAGRFWFVNVRRKKAGNGRSFDVEQIEVFDPEGRQTCSIAHEEVEKGRSYGKDTYGGLPRYVRISDGGSALLLAFGEQGWFVFGLFDTRTGKYIWGGTADTLYGTPLVRRSEVWTLAQDEGSKKDAWDRTALIHHKQGQKLDERGLTGRKVLVLPVKTDLTEDRFTVSPDGSRFVLAPSAQPDRLLLIPIREGVTGKEIRSIELKTGK